MDSHFVYMIESPRDSDLLVGRNEGTSLCEALRLADIPCWYSLVTTRKTFADSLGTRLTQAVSHFNRMPILHLSLHGDDKGVALTNGEFLTWGELRKFLTPVFNFMEGGLLICMSSCFGSRGYQMAMHEDPDYPYWGLVGNSGSPSWADAAVAYITFYHLLFKGVQVPQCVDAMGRASGDNGFQLFRGQQLKADWGAFMEQKRCDDIVAAW